MSWRFQTYMAFGAGRLARGRNQNEFRFAHLFLRRGWRLRGVDHRSGVSSCSLLRIHGVLEGVVMGPNTVLVAVPLASRGLFGGRPEAIIEVNISQPFRSKVI
jgi:hypothetical protein